MYFIVNIADGDILQTENEHVARSLAANEEFFVINMETKKVLNCPVHGEVEDYEPKQMSPENEQEILTIRLDVRDEVDASNPGRATQVTGATEGLHGIQHEGDAEKMPGVKVVDE